MKLLLTVTTAIILLTVLAACGGGASPSPTLPTFGQLAQTGQTVFTSSCARCHGDKGQGGNAPAIIGANANLKKYGTADALLKFISTTMPQTAPGSLTQQQYQQLLAYLLVQNNTVTSVQSFDAGGLGKITLK